MRKQKKRIAVIISIMVIAGMIGSFLYFGLGYLPIVGKMIATHKLSNYSDAQIKNVSFDWLNSKYTCSLNGNRRLGYRLRYDTINDERVNEKIIATANEKYRSIVNDFPINLTLPKSIDVWTEINANDYTQRFQRIYLLGVFNAETLTEEQSLEMPSTVAKTLIELMGNEYSFTGIQLIYADQNGMYELSIRSEGNQLLQNQDLNSSIRKFSEKELPLDYIEWLSQG